MEISIGALILSIWHSILFWNKDIKFSALLFAIPVIYISYKILKGKIKNKKALLISIPIILLSSTYLIFDNILFQKLNLIIIPILYVIMIMLALVPEIKVKSIIYKIIVMVIEPFNYFGEVVQQLHIQKPYKKFKNITNIIKPIFLTLIIVFIVLGLLISADTEFAKIFKHVFASIGNLLNNFSIPSIVIRIAIIVLLFFYISAFFINALSQYNVLKEFDEEESKKKDNLTIYMMLTALNLIYLVFCFIQIKSLFTIKNIIYSQYARQGFFQLMIVSLINIIMILKATDKQIIETEKQSKYKKVMCILMLIFTLIIIISSFLRMTLYQQQYGNTRLRVLVDFTLLTETILLVPTFIYVLNSKINLVKIYSIIIVTMYCIINFVNIDKIIAINNINRYEKTGKIDVMYLTYDLDTTDIIDELLQLKDTQFKYTEDKLGKENNQTMLREYLENKKTELNNKLKSVQEFNISEFKAKNMLK